MGKLTIRVSVVDLSKLRGMANWLNAASSLHQRFGGIRGTGAMGDLFFVLGVDRG